MVLERSSSTLFGMLGILFGIATGLPPHSEFENAIVSGSVNERACRLLLDTGSTYSAIEKEARKKLGVQLTGMKQLRVPSGLVAVPVCEHVEFAGRGIAADRIQPVEVDLTALNAALGTSTIEGLVGLDVLQNSVVVLIDGMVTVDSSVPRTFAADAELIQRHSILETREIPCTLRLSHKKHRQVTVDTGSNEACRITKSLLAELVAERQVVAGLGHIGADASGALAGRGHILREMTLGGVCFRNVPVTVSQDNAVGMRVLKHLTLALDFPKRQLVIGKPTRAVIDYFPQNASGITARYDQADELRVLAVRESSPASIADIRIGDVVVLLDKKKPEDLSIFEVEEILAQNGRTIPLQFRRGEEEFEAQLPLKLPFQYPPDWKSMDKEAEGFERFLKEQKAKP